MKRGISPIIATVMLVLITIIAVTVIWAAVIPLVTESFDSGTVCLDAMSELSIVTDKGRTCYNSSYEYCPEGKNCEANSNEIVPQPSLFVNIKRGPKDFDLREVMIIPTLGGSYAGDSVSFKASDYQAPKLTPNKALVFRIPNPDPLTISIDSVQIAPLVFYGGKEITCDAGPEVNIGECK